MKWRTIHTHKSLNKHILVSLWYSAELLEEEFLHRVEHICLTLYESVLLFSASLQPPPQYKRSRCFITLPTPSLMIGYDESLTSEKGSACHISHIWASVSECQREHDRARKAYLPHGFRGFCPWLLSFWQREALNFRSLNNFHSLNLYFPSGHSCWAGFYMCVSEIYLFTEK